MPAHRKPTALKLLHGDRKSTLNPTEPKFSGTAKCPNWLHPLAKQEWKRVMAEFRHTGLITAADQATFAAHCQSFARWRQAEEQIEREGQTIKEAVVTRSGNVTGYRWKKHPAVTISKDAFATMLATGRLFGLNPASRATIHTPESPAQPIDDDDDDAYLDVSIN